MGGHNNHCHDKSSLLRFRESSRKKNLTVLLEYKHSVLHGHCIYIEIQDETDKKFGVLPIRIVKSNVSSV